jgi:hypothetical protein
MTSLLNELTSAFRSPAPYLSWILLTAVLAVSGPFDTYMRFPIEERALYWSVVVAGCLIWGITARVVVQVMFARANYWVASLIVVTLSSLILAWPIHRFSLFMSGREVQYRPRLFEIAALIFFIGLFVASIRRVLTNDPAQLEVRRSTPPRLLARLDPCLRGALIRMSGRDHYVDVVTDKGKAALLLRLSDALAEVENVDGIQVHRSHWVSVAAIERAEREKGRYVLVMSDGEKVPVSRNNHSLLAERGLI